MGSSADPYFAMLAAIVTSAAFGLRSTSMPLFRIALEDEGRVGERLVRREEAAAEGEQM